MLDRCAVIAVNQIANSSSSLSSLQLEGSQIHCRHAISRAGDPAFHSFSTIQLSSNQFSSADTHILKQLLSFTTSSCRLQDCPSNFNPRRLQPLFARILTTRPVVANCQGEPLAPLRNYWKIKFLFWWNRFNLIFLVVCSCKLGNFENPDFLENLRKNNF